MAPSTKGTLTANGELQERSTLNDHSYDPFDSDDELPDERTQDRLSWRKGDDSFSDWTIIIKVTKQHNNNNNNSSKQTGEQPTESSSSHHEQHQQLTYYKVHKTAMAIGPRRSEYFVRLFNNDGNFSEAQDSTSRIELNELTAKAFPTFLDYMYNGAKKKKRFLTTYNAAALYSLAKYFDVRRLRHEAKQFCLQDMQPVDGRISTSCCTHYKLAKFLQEDTIVQAATKCFRDFAFQDDVKINWRMAVVTDHLFWLDLMQDRLVNGTIANKSRKLSCYIAHFCHLNNSNISAEVFQQLTDEKYLPNNNGSSIHPKAAVYLLDSERTILRLDEQEQQNGGRESTRATRHLSSLQIRCVNAIVRGKQEAKLVDLETRFQKFSPLVLREIIKRSFYGIPKEEQQQQQNSSQT